MQPKPAVVHLRENQHRLLLPHFRHLILFSFLPTFCALLVRDAGQLCAQSVDEDARTYLKGDYLSAGGKLNVTALERIPSLFSICLHTLKLPFCCEKVKKQVPRRIYFCDTLFSRKFK